MTKSKRNEYFWLAIVAGCVALFVIHRERPVHKAQVYDRSGMTELVRETQNAALIDPHADLETGSIVLPVKRPAAHKSRYYVPLGSYDSIDQATRRYLDLARAEPALERNNQLQIETVSHRGENTFHRLKMGNFASISSAKSACARVGLWESRCAVVEVR